VALLERPRRHPQLRVAFGPEGDLWLELGERQVQASRELLDLVLLLDGERTRAELAATLPVAGASEAAQGMLLDQLLGRLAEAGLLASEHDDEEPYFAGYAHPAVHRTMLQDESRTIAFRQALEEVVSAGDVVCDLGAGSGILSLFAAQAGAKRVHALEASPLADAVVEIVARNGKSDVIQVHRGLGEEVELGEPVDVLVSEWLGHFVSTEGMWASVAKLRERALKPGGAIVPSRVTWYLAPVGPELLEEGPGYWDTPRYGCDLSPLGAEEVARLQSEVRVILAGALLCPGLPLAELDCAKAGPDEAWIDVELTFRCERAGPLSGFCGWFDAQLSPGVLLDTSPSAPLTHWQQHWFPLPPREVAEGDELEVRLVIEPSEADERSPTYRLWVDGQETVYPR